MCLPVPLDCKVKALQDGKEAAGQRCVGAGFVGQILFYPQESEIEDNQLFFHYA